MKTFFAWVYLLPMGIYWIMFVFFHWGPIHQTDVDFVDRTAFAMFKHFIMFLAGFHFYLWYKWKDSSGSSDKTPVSTEKPD
jgi:hypothetical protein